MTPNLRGVAPALAKLHREFDDRAGKFLARVEATQSRGATVFAQAHQRLDAADGALNEVNALLDEVTQTNGGPSLDSSSTAAPPATEAAPAAAPAPLPPAKQDPLPTEKIASTSGRVWTCSWGGESFLAEPIEALDGGSWKVKALEHRPRFGAGSTIVVKEFEILKRD